jgi:hypothetical protein
VREIAVLAQNGGYGTSWLAAYHSGLRPANFTTLAHFPVSSTMSFAKKAAGYRLKTYSIEAVVWFFNSGAFWMMYGHMRAPTSTATYCLPLTE